MIYNESLAYFVIDKKRWEKLPADRTLTCGRVKFSARRHLVTERWATKREALQRMYPGSVLVLETRYKDTWHYQAIKEQK